MYVCHCVTTTDSQIIEAIRGGHTTCKSIGSATGAGTGCGACCRTIKSLIEKHSYLFDIGQKVRIKSTLQTDTHNVMDLLGEEGTVTKRYTTMLSSSRWYHVKVGNRVEPFEEHELDFRYARNPKPNKSL